MLLDVGPPAVGEPVPGEGVVHGRHHAELHQGGGDMRPPDGPLARDPRDLLPGDGDAQLVEPGDHRPRPRHPVVAHQLTLGEQGGLLGVEQVGQHVHADAVDTAGQLGSGHQREPPRQRGDGLGVSPGGVVIGQRDDVQTGGTRVADQLGRGVRTVGGRGVAVQIDAHDAGSRR